MDVNYRNGEQFEIFLNFLAHPVETPWSISTVLHQNVRRSVSYILDYIWHLRKIEMVAVLCTNETIPQFFEFSTPSPPAPQGPIGTTGGGGTSADIVPT